MRKSKALTWVSVVLGCLALMVLVYAFVKQTDAWPLAAAMLIMVGLNAATLAMASSSATKLVIIVQALRCVVSLLFLHLSTTVGVATMSGGFGGSLTLFLTAVILVFAMPFGWLHAALGRYSLANCISGSLMLVAIAVMYAACFVTIVDAIAKIIGTVRKRTINNI